MRGGGLKVVGRARNSNKTTPKLAEEVSQHPASAPTLAQVARWSPNGLPTAGPFSWKSARFDTWSFSTWFHGCLQSGFYGDPSKTGRSSERQRHGVGPMVSEKGPATG